MVAKYARYIMIFEAYVINAGVGLLCFILPETFLANFSPALGPAATVEVIRWYGVLLGVLAVMFLRALTAKDDRVLKPAVEALLFGDLAHLGATHFYFLDMPFWNSQLLFMLGMTIFLASVRIYWLWEYRKAHRA
jgi:hypothetical protein